MTQAPVSLPHEVAFYQGLDESCRSDVLGASEFFRRQLGFSSLPGPRDLERYDYSGRLLGVVRSENGIIGSIYAKASPATVLSASCVELQYLAVRPEFRRSDQRVGSYLLDLVEQAAKEKGIESARLTSLHPAVPFWKRKGYIAEAQNPCSFYKQL